MIPILFLPVSLLLLLWILGHLNLRRLYLNRDLTKVFEAENENEDEDLSEEEELNF